VYHLTDVPSFVSGQHLVVFDPHARFLPGASAAQPGLRVNLSRGQLLQHFPDACAPYMHFGCTMQARPCALLPAHACCVPGVTAPCGAAAAPRSEPAPRACTADRHLPCLPCARAGAAHTTTRAQGTFPGTLFRFPLRTDALAAVSDIKAQAFSAAGALDLLRSLRDVLPQALLFLKSVRTLEVHVVEGADARSGTAAAASGGGGESASACTEPGQPPRLLFKAQLQPLDGEPAWGAGWWLEACMHMRTRRGWAGASNSQAYEHDR
jgi:hypothetical protein